MSLKKDRAKNQNPWKWTMQKVEVYGKMYPVKSKKGRIQMDKFPLPKEYVKELNESPYVQKATEWCVTFTTEFKQYAYEEMHKGKSTRQVFEEVGFDCKKLGKKRLGNFKRHLTKQAEREEGFEDLRKYNYRKESVSSEAELKKRNQYLEHRIAYLEQENDFLKKLHRWKRHARRSKV